MGRSLSVKEAAKIIGLSENKVKSMCVSGDLAAVKFGNRWKITEEEVSRVQHGEAPSEVTKELKNIGIPDIEEFIKLREALHQAQIIQDNRAEEINQKDELANQKYTALKDISLRIDRSNNKRVRHIELIKEAVGVILDLQKTYACFSQGNLPHKGLVKIANQLSSGE